MVRKTRIETESTYAALLDAAERVFKDKGVAAATLNDIASAAGMTRGAIYWHFKDKAELVHAMCERATLPMEAVFNEVTAVAGDDPLGSIRRLTVHALTQVAQSPQQQTVFDILFHKCEKTGEMAPMFEREQQSRSECHSEIEAILRQAVKLGQLPADTDTAMAMQALHAFMVGLMHEWLLDPGAYDLAAHAEALVDTLLAGLRAAPPRIRLTRSRAAAGLAETAPTRGRREKIAA
ncbi:MAG TPA: TetR family transcriptional regulator [Casimicrobium huifangae]|nr:TetR family transcriptional regulator [Casimicrobium huifangae]HQA34673.1 TetR family transcriptional regulator [Casimicrobium huifangae]